MDFNVQEIDGNKISTIIINDNDYLFTSIKIINIKRIKNLEGVIMNKKAAIIAGVAIVGLLGAFTLGGKDKAQETEVKGTEIVAVQDENGTIEVTKNPRKSSYI